MSLKEIRDEIKYLKETLESLKYRTSIYNFTDGNLKGIKQTVEAYNDYLEKLMAELPIATMVAHGYRPSKSIQKEEVILNEIKELIK